MAMTPEAKVKKDIRKILDANGVYYAMPIGSGFGNSGVPDFLCCVHGWFVAIEAKAGKGKTTALQEANMENIRKSAGVTLVVREDDLSLVQNVIDAITNLKERGQTPYVTKNKT